MKNWNWSKIMQAILLLIGAIGGGTYMVNESGILTTAPATEQEYKATPNGPVKYVVSVQVIWKQTNNALPDAKYMAVTHRIEMDKVPTLGSAFNAVRDAFVNDKLKAPVEGYTPVYPYTAEVITRIGIPLADDGKKPETQTPITE